MYWGGVFAVVALIFVSGSTSMALGGEGSAVPDAAIPSTELPASRANNQDVPGLLSVTGAHSVPAGSAFYTIWYQAEFPVDSVLAYYPFEIENELSNVTADLALARQSRASDDQQHAFQMEQGRLRALLERDDGRARDRFLSERRAAVGDLQSALEERLSEIGVAVAFAPETEPFFQVFMTPIQLSQILTWPEITGVFREGESASTS